MNKKNELSKMTVNKLKNIAAMIDHTEWLDDEWSDKLECAVMTMAERYGLDERQTDYLFENFDELKGI
jgi:hypothetical protein